MYSWVRGSVLVRRASWSDVEEMCRIMVATEPYTTLGYTWDMCCDTVESAVEEGWSLVAEEHGSIVGFILFRVFDGFPLGGYIRALAVAEKHRGRGVGSALMSKAEEKILEYRDNVFLLVSSFNKNALKFYLKRGYSIVGEIPDAILKGHSEIIMRKTRSAEHKHGSNIDEQKPLKT